MVARVMAASTLLSNHLFPFRLIELAPGVTAEEVRANTRIRRSRR